MTGLLSQHSPQLDHRPGLVGWGGDSLAKVLLAGLLSLSLACSGPTRAPTHPSLAAGQGTSSDLRASQARAAVRKDAAASKAATKQSDANIKRLGLNASQLHGAMVREKVVARCEALRRQRDEGATRYAKALIRRLEDQMSAKTARAVFAQAAGIGRARWVQPAEQHRARALLRRAGALLWRSMKTERSFGARLARVQAAAAWVLQLPHGDPTVQAWRTESGHLAEHHAKLRQQRVTTPFAASLQNKLVRELGGASHPQARRWLMDVVRHSSLRLDVQKTATCAPAAARIRAALQSPFGVRVPVRLQLTECGARSATAPGGAAVHVLVGVGTLVPPGAATIDVALALGAKTPLAQADPTKALSRDAIDRQLGAAAAKRIRAAAAPVRQRLAEVEMARARRAKTPLQAEEYWLHALAWAGTLPADGAAFLAKQLSLSVAQARAAQSLRWARPRLLLRMPTRPYPVGRPHLCRAP